MKFLCSRRLFIAAACLPILATSIDARGLSPCGPHSDVIERLEDKYGETVRMIGIVADSSILQVLASEETGTWTIIAADTSGVTCFVAAGQSFEEIVPQSGEEL